ncbi:MAG: hypothetical protein JWN76_3619 [Chitinophagaceae bacterium]|nr:hypothetical protein [Chitinophagaceae bacterium]
MAINKNHEFEDMEGVKCAIVERNASKERVEFLKTLLTYNGYEVIVLPSPPPKLVAVPKPVAAVLPVIGDNGESVAPPPEPVLPEVLPLPPPETFTVGVTNVMFNPTNAVFGRLLRTHGGHVVTLAYWEQKEEVPNDEVPYFENSKEPGKDHN